MVWQRVNVHTHTSIITNEVKGSWDISVYYNKTSLYTYIKKAKVHSKKKRFWSTNHIVQILNSIVLCQGEEKSSSTTFLVVFGFTHPISRWALTYVKIQRNIYATEKKLENKSFWFFSSFQEASRRHFTQQFWNFAQRKREV